MQRKLAFITGIAAISLASTAITLKYRDYWHDPDIWKKINYDIFCTPKIGKYSENVHENNLYELLYQGDYKEFQEELERESKWFSRHYNVNSLHSSDNVEIDRTWLPGFDDYQTLLSYLQGDSAFLKESLKRGYFLDSFVIAQQRNLNPEKTCLLLSKGNIQTYHTGAPVIIETDADTENTEDTDSANLEEFVTRNWLFRLKYHLGEISRWDNKDVIETFGETRKRFFDLAKKRYMATLKQYPEILSDEEKTALEQRFIH